jgi:hypothetical protein
MPPTAYFIIPLSFAVVCGLIGIVYSVAIFFIHTLVVAKIAMTLIWGGSAGYIASYSIRLCHARNGTRIVLLACLGALIGFYISWAFWLTLVNSLPFRWDTPLSKFPNPRHVTFFDWLGSPGVMIDFIKEINLSGTWKFRGNFVSGGFLTFCWIVEFVLYMLVVSGGLSVVGLIPYYEEGKTWFKVVKLMKNSIKTPVSRIDLTSVINKINDGDFTYFMNTPVLEGNELPNFTLEFMTAQGAPFCYLTIDLVTQASGKSDSNSTDKTTLVQYAKIDEPMASALLKKFTD